jgi:hypothetical protein
MPTPFPGMDPYLEQRGIWEQVHTSLIVAIQYHLTPLLRPKYRVAIEQRSYLTLLPPGDQLVGVPDALITAPDRSGSASVMVMAAIAAEPEVGVLPMAEEVRERYLEIRDVHTELVVTVIEILSPSNKLSKTGREQYETKRMNVLSSLTNLVEIDLLRAGRPFAMKASRQTDYRIVISRRQQRPHADLYLFNLRQPIPSFPIPLRPGEQEPVLPLNQLLHTLYDQGGYDLAIDYSRPVDPPLAEADAHWATELLDSHSIHQ